jgi:hypothetical protein
MENFHTANRTESIFFESRRFGFWYVVLIIRLSLDKTETFIKNPRKFQQADSP